MLTPKENPQGGFSGPASASFINIKTGLEPKLPRNFYILLKRIVVRSVLLTAKHRKIYTY